MDEDKIQQRRKSQWSNFVNTITDFGFHVAAEARGIFSKSRSDSLSSEFLFDPHATYHRRSYGAIPPYTEDFGHTTPNGDRQESGFVLETESLPSDEEQPMRSNSSTPEPADPIPISFSPLPVFQIEEEVSQTRERKVVIPIINIHPEQDFNFLTVDAAMKIPGGNGRVTPGRKSSGFLSGSVSPLTVTSSFEFNNQDSLPPERFTWGRILKIIFLVAIFIIIAIAIISTSENNPQYKLITVSSNLPYQSHLHISETMLIYYPILTVSLVGAFAHHPYDVFTNNTLTVEIEKRDRDGKRIVVSTEESKWEIPIFSSPRTQAVVTQSSVSHEFNLNDLDWEYESVYYMVFRTNTSTTNAFAVSARLLSEVIEIGAICGALVIIGLYILIIFELVNRTLASMLAAAAAIGCLAAINERPTTTEMVSWLDMETLILLFSMMVIVAILCETGFFDYASFLMYKLASGRVWPLITSLCFFTAIVSAFLDNVTTILLMTPVTIRICESMELNPVPVLISIVIFSNIGGAVTPVGDPPNVIISNNKDVIDAGIDFATFFSHMVLAIVPVILVAYLQLRFIFRSMKSLKFSEPYEVTELRREIDVWSRAADSLCTYSKDESQIRSLLLSKVVYLQNKFKAKVRMGGQSEENFQANLIDLEARCKIRDWGLLIKCVVVLTIVIIVFFLHSIPELNLSIGWTALLGTVFLLILADRRELEGILCRVEWSTLIFFSALFIVMEGVSRLGLLEWIGNQTEAIIMEVNEEARLTVATLLILWVSGIASAFIDNIPFVTMMVKIVARLAERVSLPLQPLIWALALGTCLGGNGTLIGASANVVAAGVANQHGYKFTFMGYFKIGFPMMIMSLIVSTVYLLISHTFLQWND